jgi:hypothetical protein
MWILAAIALCLLVCFAPLWFIRREPVRPAPVSPDLVEQVASRIRADGTTHILSREPDTGVTNEPGLVETRTHDDPPRDAAAGVELNLKRRYQWIVRLLLPIQIVLFLGFGVVWALAFHFLGEAHASSFTPSVEMFKPVYGAPFGVTAVFMGIFTAAIADSLLLRAILGRRRYTEYRHWEQARFGVHGPSGAAVLRQIFTALAVVVAVPTVIALPFVFNWSARFTETEIRLRPLLSVRDDVRSYDSVTKIVHNTHDMYNGKLMEMPGLHLEFADGSTWENGSLYLADHGPGMTRLLDLLRRKTNVPIDHVQLRN